MRLKVFAGDLDAHKCFNGGALTLKSLRPGSTGAIARFAEVADRNAAEALRGTELSVPRSALPAAGRGRILSCRPDRPAGGFPTPGEALGIVVAVENFGAGDVIEIERPPNANGAGKRFMVPMRPEAVPEWDGERLVVAEAFVEA